MQTIRTVTGAVTHYGRAELVTLGVPAAGGGAPVLLDRRRVALIDEGLPGAPYHHECLELELEEGARLVTRVRESVAEHARAALRAVRAEHSLHALVLQASPYERLPDSLAAVLASYALTCAADGMLYREALADAADELGLHVLRYPRKTDPTSFAAEALGLERREVAALVAELGRAAGSPWRKDHKDAAAAALGALARRLRS